MLYIAKEDVEPLTSEHGETIYELIGQKISVSTERHSVAYVVIPPGKSSLLHLHPEAEESYYILRGQAQMLFGDEGWQIQEEAMVEAGNAILIPKLKSHQIINVGDENLEFIAFCVPAWELTNSRYPLNKVDFKKADD